MSLPGSALVLGLRRSGHAAALALARRGVRVVGVDRDAAVEAGRLAEAGVEVHLGSEEERLVDAVELVVKSPGVPKEAPLVGAARARGLPVWSEVELGYRILDRPILGVTGTNGKTTTSELLGAIFRAGGRGVAVAGNVGRALCELDEALAADDWVVCELSSFQLEDIHELRAPIAVLLNLEPDHLDRHDSFEDYRDAKLRLFDNQSAGDVAVVPRGFGPVPGEGRRVEFDAGDALPTEPLIPGAHNRENAAAATAAARAAGIDDDAIAQALRTFEGVPHRLEPVRELAGVRYVNDSKATNVAAALRALAAFDVPIVLIAGGRAKGESFRPLAEAASRVKLALTIGEAGDQIGRELESTGVRVERLDALLDAVERARAVAEPDDVVLLSPACASYDQFTSFEERGDTFRRLVEELA
jgi:UDP-N-acetylmuramoylalanine--D-glutamate ligase